MWALAATGSEAEDAVSVAQCGLTLAADAVFAVESVAIVASCETTIFGALEWIIM